LHDAKWQRLGAWQVIGVKMQVPFVELASHASVVQALLSLHVLFVCTQPVLDWQVSIVHDKPSSQLIAAFMQAPSAALHESLVHTLLSSQDLLVDAHPV
jgi:hypothetical protein